MAFAWIDPASERGYPAYVATRIAVAFRDVPDAFEAFEIHVHEYLPDEFWNAFVPRRRCEITPQAVD